MRKLFLSGVAVVALSAGAVAYANQPVFAPKSEVYDMLELFGDALTVIQRNYVVPVDEKKLIESALDGMVSALDPHSSYLSPDETKALSETIEGTYGGLGIEVTSEDGAIKVVTPLDDSPAARAGLQPGDYITAIDSKSIIGLRQSEAVSQMRGVAGTKIKVTIVREGADAPFDVELTRETIKDQSVKWRMEGDYGVLRITKFNKLTAEESEKGLAELKAKNPAMKGLVLDLRNNPGGLLDQSVKVADLFLEGGEIVSQRGRKKTDIARYNATRGDVLKGLPMVVLVNQGSASAAEIVAGALQDHKRAPIVGLTSFGKGSVQQEFRLSETRGLKLTTARYYTPSGRSIQRTGIEPDLEVAQSREQAKLIATSSFQFSEAAYRNALDADEGKARRGEHEVSEIPPEDHDVKTGDFQLLRAFDVLAAKGDIQAVMKNRRGKAVAASDLVEKPGARFEKSGKPADKSKEKVADKPADKPTQAPSTEPKN